jgi:cell division protease FtsH
MFGMSRLGRIFLREGENNPFLPSFLAEGPRECSEETAREVDIEVRKIIDSATEQVREILRRNQPALDRVALRLIEKEVIDGAELHELLKESAFAPDVRVSPVGVNGTFVDSGNNHIKAGS